MEPKIAESENKSEFLETIYQSAELSITNREILRAGSNHRVFLGLEDCRVGILGNAD